MLAQGVECFLALQHLVHVDAGRRHRKHVVVHSVRTVETDGELIPTRDQGCAVAECVPDLPRGSDRLLRRLAVREEHRRGLEDELHDLGGGRGQGRLGFGRVRTLFSDTSHRISRAGCSYRKRFTFARSTIRRPSRSGPPSCPRRACRPQLRATRARAVPCTRLHGSTVENRGEPVSGAAEA